VVHPPPLYTNQYFTDHKICNKNDEEIILQMAVKGSIEKHHRCDEHFYEEFVRLMRYMNAFDGSEMLKKVIGELLLDPEIAQLIKNRFVALEMHQSSKRIK